MSGENNSKGKDWEEVSPPGPDEEGSSGGDESKSAEEYKVELPVFEGPLDLLLHLIRKHEIDVFDIPIALVTDKYLAYLEWMRVLDVNIAGEFLVMAATLAHIKSRMLLPPDEAEGEDEPEEEGDPREELVKRLLEYQRYKEAAGELRDQLILDRDVFARGSRTPAADPDSPFSEVSVFKLIEALDRVMKKNVGKVTHDVMVERVSIADRIHELADMLQGGREVVFEQLFEEAVDRAMIVVTFLALLEMARLRMLRLHQADNSEVIHVRSSLDGRDVNTLLADANVDE